MGSLLEPGGRAPDELAVRAGGVLMLAGGLLAGAIAILPPAAGGSGAVIVATAVVASLIGALLLALRPRLGRGGLGGIALLGTVLITLTTYLGGPEGSTGDNEMLYLWVCLFSFYFLTTPQALLQLGAVGAAYAWLLSQSVSEQLLTQWLTTTTTLLIAGLVIAKLRASLYRTVGELSDQVRHDGLTGLLNRSAFEERVVVERARSMREDTPISVLAVDIDDFKPLNDKLGHLSGDEVLRAVAEALQDRTRKIDAVGRVGGDEFAVLVPGASEDEAKAVAEDLCLAISRQPGVGEQPLTVSIGVATGCPPMPDFEELWRAADAAMYAGKRAGGNRVCLMPARAGRTEESLVS